MAKYKVQMAAFVRCSKCGEEHMLSDLLVLNAGTNDREEDVVEFDCPDCKKRNTSCIWTRSI